ncbi:MAG: ATP-binding protein [Planctomycetota bacterium]
MPHIKLYLDLRIVEPLAIVDGTSIGRGAEADIVVMDYSVAPIHALFQNIGGRFLLKNLATPPFIVNGNPIPEQIFLKDRDEIYFGKKRLIYSEYEQLWPPAVFMVDLASNPTQEFPLATLVEQSEILFRCLTEDDPIQRIQQMIPEILTERQIDPLIVMNLETVIHESLNNAARHGHQYQRNKVIHLYYQILANEIRLSILDEGVGFDYAYTLDQAEGADAVNAARSRYKSGGYGGLGFIMMLKCLSGIEFNAKGNWVTLIKKFEAN